MGRDGAGVTAGTVCTMATMTFDIAGKPVGRIGYGAMQLPGPGVMGPPRDHDEAIAVLRRAVEAGVNHIDTAQYYGPNVANELIREALHPYPDDLVIVSKVGAARDEAGGWHAAQTPADLRAGVEDNLRTLGVEQLGAVNLRRLEHDMSDEPRVPLADQLAEMVALREEGKIAGVGISTAPSLTSTRRSGLRRSCVQRLQPLARDDGVCSTVHRRRSSSRLPLGLGLPRLPKSPTHPVAARVGATPAQVGLAWLLARADNILLIPGTSSLAHLEENLAVRDLVLSAADQAELGNC